MMQSRLCTNASKVGAVIQDDYLIAIAMTSRLKQKQ